MSAASTYTGSAHAHTFAEPLTCAEPEPEPESERAAYDFCQSVRSLCLIAAFTLADKNPFSNIFNCFATHSDGEWQ